MRKTTAILDITALKVRDLEAEPNIVDLNVIITPSKILVMTNEKMC